MPGPRKILHIGYPKTGTTWLQNVFFPGVSNYTYLNHDSLPSWYFDRLVDIDPGKIESFREGYAPENVIVSAERMVGNVNNMYLNPAKFKTIFPDADILVLLREQVDKFASNYSHHILMGGNCSIDEFLFPEGDKRLFNGQKHQYDVLLDAYKEAFGKERVHVFLFEEFKDRPEEFLENLVRLFGLDVRYNTRDLYIPQNKRLSYASIQLMKIFNHFTRRLPPYHKKSRIPKRVFFHIPLWGQATAHTVQFLNQKGLLGTKKYGTKEILGSDNMEFLKEYFAESNRNLVSHHGLAQIRDYNYAL